MTVLNLLFTAHSSAQILSRAVADKNGIYVGMQGQDPLKTSVWMEESSDLNL